MFWFWFVGACVTVVDFIGGIVIFPTIMIIIQSAATNLFALLYDSQLVWTIVIGILSIIQLIMGVIHLILYSKGYFISESKVGHALYQFFFGIGVLGSIIVLAVDPSL